VAVRTIRRGWRGSPGQRGASIVEYLLLVGMAALLVLGALRLFGSSLGSKVACQALAIAELSAGACGASSAEKVQFGHGPEAPVDGPPPAEKGGWDELGEALRGGLNPTSGGGKLCFGSACFDGACFVGGTEVLGADGPVDIDALAPGDWVLARDQESGAVDWQRVARVSVTADREILDLELHTDAGDSEILGVTPEHPFWSAARGWVAAGELELGERLASADGRALAVASMALRAERATVYNLEVEAFHTYFVGSSGAWVHNDCEPAEDPLRRMLEMSPYLPQGPKPVYGALQGIRNGNHRNWPVPKPPPGASPDLRDELDKLKKRIGEADKELQKREKVYREWLDPKTAEASRKAGFDSGGFSVEMDAEGTKRSDAVEKAAREVHDALVRYIASVDAVRRGGELRYDDRGKVNHVTYPSGASVRVKQTDRDEVISVTFTEPDGTVTSVYQRPAIERGVWRLETGKFPDDPVAFRGDYRADVDGTLVRTVGNRKVSLSPDGRTTPTWTKPDAYELKPELPGGLSVTITRAEDGIALSVRSGDAGVRSSVVRLPFDPSQEANPKILKKDGDVVLISLDGSDAAHVAISATEKPWGEGLAYRERRVPYLDGLRPVLRDLPPGTKSLDLHIATAGREVHHTWVTPLPKDENYMLPPRWRPGTFGRSRFDGAPKMGWFKGNQFVADTTAIDRRWAHFVDEYMTNMTRAAPVVGPLVMAGEAITGSEINGRAMTPRERVIHGAFAVVGGALEFGPAALSAAQSSRAISQIQKASGVSRAEAKALLDETRALGAEERALLKAAAEGKAVDAQKLAPVVQRIEQAMARVRPPPAANPAGALARAEAAAARPAVAGAGAAKEAVSARFAKSNPELEKALHGLLDDTAHRLNVVETLKDPATRARTLDLLEEMFQGKALRGQSLAEFLQANPGKGSVYEPVAREINVGAGGESRKVAHVEAMKKDIPAMRAGANPSAAEMEGVRDYARYLKDTVEPSVSDELAALVREINAESGGGASFSVRTKSADGLIDKVKRMVTGEAGRGVRPDYQVGDVIDGVGGRITVENMDQLAKVLDKVRSRFGAGDGGRILEIENMYASPKSSSPRYRVIPMIVKARDGKGTFELQLTTRRASIAADLDHNVNYKPILDATEAQKELIRRMQAEATALDQLESLGRRPLPSIPELPGGGGILPVNPGALGPAVVPKSPERRDEPPAVRKP
jgi:ppGpp synthetase/RelA/SpoT-type nucleotidyltranferase/Flp pilus assembly pilin Flp